MKSGQLEIFALNQPTVQQLDIDYSKDYIRDGRNDDFPARIINMVQGSTIGAALVDIRRRFLIGAEIEGAGLDAPANSVSELTKRQIIERAISDYAVSDRCFVQIIPAKRGNKVIETFNVPFEYVRLGIQNEYGQSNFVYTNPFLNTSQLLQKADRYFPIWRTNPALNRRAISEWNADLYGEYLGHMLVHQRLTPFNRNYSRPALMLSEPWLRADSGLGQFHANNIESNFFLGGILHIFGDPNEPVIKGTDSQGVSITEPMSEKVRRDIAANFSGAKNAGTVMVMYFTEADQKGTFERPPMDGSDRLFTALSDEVTAKLCIATNTPRILLGVATEGKLGQTGEFVNAFNYMNQHTKAERDHFERMFSELFGTQITITPLSPDSELPDTIFNALDPQTKADYIQNQYGLTLQAVEVVTVDQIQTPDPNANTNPAN